MKRSNLVEVFFAISLIIALVSFQMPRLRMSSSQNDSVEAMQEKSMLLAFRLTAAKKLPSLGFDNLIADWFFLNFLQYFGDVEVRKQTDYLVSPDFFKVIIDNDPRFFASYVFLSMSTSIYAAQPQLTVDLMEKGLSHMTFETPPEAAIVWRYKGVDELLFLGQPKAAEVSYKTAAEWAGQSPDPAVQATAEMSRQTAEFIAENPDSRRTLVTGWSQILSQAVDETTFNLAVEQIEALGGEVFRDENGQITIRIQSQNGSNGESLKN